MLEVFYNLVINSYSSFSSRATFCSISIRLLFSSRMLFINFRLYCCFLSSNS